MKKGYDYYDMVKSDQRKKKRPRLYLPHSYLFSYPKSGRTWVRMILAKLLQDLGENIKKMEMVTAAHWSYSEAKSKIVLSDSRVAMISRDPRDILVSYYFELTKRTKNSFSGSISDFIRNEAYGIRPLLEYYNDWYTFRHELKDFLVITYEDLSFDTFSEINKLIHFFGLSNDITDEMIEQAIEFSRFENMRKIEIEDKKKNLLSSYHGSFGRRHKVEQSTSLRTRKGKVGGYRDYLSDEDIQYLDAEIKQNLHSFFSEQTKRQQIAT